MDMDMDTAEDVVFSILLRLPVKALLRFKTVCRYWRSIIESSFFISQHLHRHHHLDDLDEDSWNLIAFQPPVVSWIKLELYLLSGNNFQLGRNLQFRVGLGEFPKIIATFDGIVCLQHGEYPDISLWNPATGEFKTLPRAPQPCTFVHSPAAYCYGFGFDVKTNDYKVVSIFMPDWNNTPSSIKAHVYSLSNNSWRSIDAVLPVDCIISNPRSPFLNGGIYYWTGLRHYENYSRFDNQIFYFDFSSEVFGTIPVPDVYRELGWGLFLGYLRKNIVCMGCDQNSTKWQIWGLNQCGVTYSWTKLYTLPVQKNGFFFTMSKNGNMLWRRIRGQSRAYLSHPVTQERNFFPIEQPSPHFQAALYKESLVSIKGAMGATATRTI